MPAHVPTWWTEDRVDTTVNRTYINAQLTQDEQELLEQSTSFGGGLTDDTYLDWIVGRAKKLFLVLVDIGVPDQIFGLVDESYDDEDLPIAAEAVQDLRLAQDPDRSLDKKFYKSQFKFLVKPIRDGDHVCYTEEETIPVETVGLKPGLVVLGNGTDKVRLASSPHEIYVRKRILDQPSSSRSEHDVLSEVASLRKLAHQHLISIYASYAIGSNIYVLLSPAVEYTLKSFITDTPKSFDNLPKPDRREILINWPHCLSNGLDWLHSKRLHHGAIRPTNIQVDVAFRIFLGNFDGFNVTNSNVKIDDVETYQYAAPERWKRAATMQTSGLGKAALPSGSRTGRKYSDVKETNGDTNTNGKRTSWNSQGNASLSGNAVDSVKAISQGLPFKLGMKGSNSRSRPDKPESTYAASMHSSTSSNATSNSRSDAGGPSGVQSRSYLGGNPIPSIAASVVTADTTGNGAVAGKVLREPVILAPPEHRTAIVQTWHSAQYDPLSADIFALGAIIADILTLLCKRTCGAFTRHRSAKNRTAGRGGGLADASFHANLGQVHGWLGLLVNDAKKKASKDEGRTYGAIEPMIEVVKACLEREPENRIDADQLEKRLGDCACKSANISTLHCYKTLLVTTSKVGDGVAVSTATRRKSNAKTIHDLPDNRDLPIRIPSRLPPLKDSMAGESMDEVGKRRSSRQGPETSYSSLSTFDFDYGFNESLSDDEHGDATVSAVSGREFRDTASERINDIHDFDLGPDVRTNYQALRWEHDNDSQVDPYLAIFRSNNDNVDGSETSGSEDAHQKSFFLPDSRRTSMMPDQEDQGTLAERERMPLSLDTYNEQGTLQSHKAQGDRRGILAPRLKQHISQGPNQPNTSRPRTSLSAERLQSVQFSLSADSGVEQHRGRKISSSANFSRPRRLG